MPLIKDGRVADDPWLRLADEEEPEPGVPVIVSLERWQAERNNLSGRNAPLGLWLRSDQSPAAVADDLRYFDLIALEFPKFSDGRAFSYARLLRERYGFEGELRAVGEVLRDLLLYMHRCGFNAFAIDRDDALERWQAAIGEMSVWYQPTEDGRPFTQRQRAPAAAKESLEEDGRDIEETERRREPQSGTEIDPPRPKKDAAPDPLAAASWA